MSTKLFIYHRLASWIPESRLYLLKSKLLKKCNFAISNTARISSSAKFIGAFDLSIGDDTYIGHDVLVAGGKCTISIGHSCDLAPRVSLIAGTHEIDMVGAHTAGVGYSQDIIIEDGVWIGTCATVLGGVRIGTKSVIAAGSTVTQDIPANVIAAGTPCRVIKTWDASAMKWTSVE